MSRSRQDKETYNRYSYRSKEGVTLSKNDRVILVMGPPGAGKSTFIQTLTKETTGIGHHLNAETRVLALYCLERPSHRRICLVDTPGFDDAKRLDADALEIMAGWLAATYKRGIVPSGLLFLHRISDLRVDGGTLKNLKMFRKLCGEECFQNVVLVTTMWSEVDKNKGQQRETDLCTHFWKPLIDRGSQVKGFMDDQNSAIEIVSLLNHKTPLPLLVQRQMVDEGKTLAATSAGIAVDGDLERMSKEHKQDVMDSQRERNRNLRKGNVTFRNLAEEEMENAMEAHGRAAERRRSLRRNIWKWITGHILKAVIFHVR